MIEKFSSLCLLIMNIDVLLLSESHFEADEYEEDDDNAAASCYSESSRTEAAEAVTTEDDDNAEEEVDENDASPSADLGSGWGRIIYMPFRRGKRVELDVCRSTNSEGSEGSFDRVVITQRRNPALHHQARRSLWGDLWPLRSEKNSKFYM